MAFCANCGTQIEEGIKFCPGCGAPVLSAGVEIKQDKAVNIIQAQPAFLPMSGVLANQNTLMVDEKYCFSCGSPVKKAAKLCLKCGVNQSARSSTVAIDVYCISCGKSIKKEAAICPFCGVQLFEKNKKGFAIASLVLGIGGFGAWLFPLLGFPVTIVGLIMGVVGRKSINKKMAIAGLVLSMIGLAATIVNSSIGAYMGATAAIQQTQTMNTITITKTVYQGNLVRGSRKIPIMLILNGFENKQAINSSLRYTGHNDVPIRLEGRISNEGTLILQEQGNEKRGILRLENFNIDDTILTGTWVNSKDQNDWYNVTLKKE